MNAELLIPAAELARHLTDPDWVVVDCRFDLLQPEAGQRAYAGGHIPGAFYADLDRELSGPKHPDLGRHPLPEPDRLRKLFSSFGIQAGSRVVAYDDASGGLAARFWWLLRWMGHRSAGLLDGGLAAWRQAGLPLGTEIPSLRSGHFVGQPGGMPVMETAEVEQAIAVRDIVLLDLRAQDRYLGRIEPIDPVAGHVPGAVSAPFTGNLGPDGRFRAPGDLRDRYSALLGGRSSHDAVCMCGSGVTACHGLFALELAGLPGARLYPGSWSEWIRSPARPVAKEESAPSG